MGIADLIKSMKKNDAGTGQVPGPDDPVVTPTPQEKTGPGSGTGVPGPGTPEQKKTDAPHHHFSRLLKGREKSAIEEYDFEHHGNLVDVRIPDGYEQVDQYWVEQGCSLIVIGLNKRTNQNEYLLFEPSLSDFEYELLERLYEDLRDVLILSSEEIRKDRKRILL